MRLPLRKRISLGADWKKITEQPAEKRDACRRYRPRRRNPDTARHSRDSEAFYGVYEPATRTIYTNGVPSTAACVDALLDAILLTGICSTRCNRRPSRCVGASAITASRSRSSRWRYRRRVPAAR